MIESKYFVKVTHWSLLVGSQIETNCKTMMMMMMMMMIIIIIIIIIIIMIIIIAKFENNIAGIDALTRRHSYFKNLVCRSNSY